MLAASIGSLFRRSPNPDRRAPPELVLSAAGALAQPQPIAQAATGPATAWPASRLSLVHDLWGDGFIFPGGELEALRLTRPLGISAASSFLLVGVGSGGPAISITRNFGAWVTAMETDPSLLAAARGAVTRAQLAKKIKIKAWNPNAPDLPPKSHHHCLALEPLHDACPEPVLDALAAALKPGGQLMMTELVAPNPLNPADRSVRRWAELERRDPAALLAPVAVTRMLGRIGLDVRVAEDMSNRHLEHALIGWRTKLHELEGKLHRQEAVSMVAEAELWLLRRRLIRDGQLRMMRWHGISRLPII